MSMVFLRMVWVVVLLTAGFAVVDAAGQASRTVTGTQATLPNAGTNVALYEQGRAALLDFRLQEADRIHTRLARNPDSRADAYYALSVSHLSRALLDEEDASFAAFFAYNDSLSSALGELPETPWNRHLAAEVHFHRAFALAQRGNYVRAAAAARRAYGHYSRNVRDNPHFFDSYRGRGIFRVIVGSTPASYRWILNLLGFGGTVAQGFEDLQLAANRAEYTREESQMVLGIVDIMINEERLGGLDRLKRLHGRHPSSPLFSYLYAFALLHERDADAAERVLRPHVTGSNPQQYRIVQSYYYYGESLFRKNQFDEAARYYKRFIDQYNGSALMANAHLKRGISLEMLGQYEQAKVYYGRVRSARDFDGDKFAQRQARERLRAPMTAVERNLILGMNAQDGGRFDEAIAYLTPILNDTGSPSVIRAESAYRLGRSLQGVDRLSEAMYYFQFAVDNPGDRTARWGPWSQYYIGVIYAEMGHRDQARQAFDRVLAIRGSYDFSQALEQRTRAALSRL